MDRKATDYEDVLRRLTVNDQAFVRTVLASTSSPPLEGVPDPMTEHLVRLGALIAMDAGASAIDAEVAEALASGASRSAVVGVLLSVGPFVGSARLIGMAPRIADAIGFDVFAELERPAGRNA